MFLYSLLGYIQTSYILTFIWFFRRVWYSIYVLGCALIGYKLCCSANVCPVFCLITFLRAMHNFGVLCINPLVIKIFFLLVELLLFFLSLQKYLFVLTVLYIGRWPLKG